MSHALGDAGSPYIVGLVSNCSLAARCSFASFYVYYNVIITFIVCLLQDSNTYAHNHFTALLTLSRTTRVSRYQKKHSRTHNHCGHQSSLICFLHLLRSMASSLFNLGTLESLSTVSVQVFFGLPLGQ